MDPRSRAIIIGVIALLVLAVILVFVFYRGVITGPHPEDQSTTIYNLPTVSLGLSPTATPSAVLGTKLYQGKNFSLRYPVSWGMLTCSNSENFEFDPYSSADLKNIVCDFAVKPITVLLVNQLSCSGNTVTVGTYQIIKSSQSKQTGVVENKWCLGAAGRNFEITNRVSAGGERATGKDDFSAKIEDMIKTISSAPQGS